MNKIEIISIIVILSLIVLIWFLFRQMIKSGEIELDVPQLFLLRK